MGGNHTRLRRLDFLPEIDQARKQTVVVVVVVVIRFPPLRPSPPRRLSQMSQSSKDATAFSIQFVVRRIVILRRKRLLKSCHPRLERIFRMNEIASCRRQVCEDDPRTRRRAFVTHISRIFCALTEFHHPVLQQRHLPLVEPVVRPPPLTQRGRQNPRLQVALDPLPSLPRFSVGVPPPGAVPHAAFGDPRVQHREPRRRPSQRRRRHAHVDAREERSRDLPHRQ